MAIGRVNRLPSVQDALDRAWVRVLLAVATMLSLISIGGIVLVTGPVLVPAHWWAAKRSRLAERLGWLLLAAITVTETVWMATYLMIGEYEPQIWLLPSIAFLVTLTVLCLQLDMA